MIKDYVVWLKQVINKPSKYAILRRFVIFKELSSFELHLIDNYLHPREYKKGEMLFEEGYPLEAVFFIDKGEVQVSGPINSQETAVLKKNQFIGLIDMFNEDTRSSTAKAITDVSVLALSRTDLWYLINHNRVLGNKLLVAISRFLSKYLVEIASGQQR
ncbi:MAG: cyclic nucleotide-binding domain-containing protein [Candidatus Cloacimonadaceae bacterium]|nr:cyclic nucleotide-binding domain-containing protein [Candidatus Cloacimonadaceae bacterium]MDP3114605.1 cyclic nucleotide-binding domain-containing protein [Candidatus Cloacimonadaceae bacterium]